MSDTLESNAIILAPRFTPAPVQVSAGIIADIEEAVACEALLGKVTNAEENRRAVDAQARQKLVIKKIEDARKAIKEPFLEICRAIDTKAAELKDELEKECGRLNALTVPWGIQERRRLQEEAEAQRRELERIEAEKQAAIRKAKAEQEQREREAREATERAERAAREAKDEESRKAAEKLAQDAEAHQQRAAQAAVEVVAVLEKVEEECGRDSYFASRPIVADIPRGQKMAQDWEITVTDPYALAKFHPHAVTIKPLMGVIKQMLREGVTVNGIRTEETVNTSVRAKRERPATEA